jgi:hypothetical protein
MLKSQLISDVFNLIFDDSVYEDKLRSQIQFLKQGKTEHTGVGIFIYFEAEKGIENYKISTEKNENRNVDGKTTERINGVELRNNDLKILADIDVHITDGIIDCVEIWNKNGEEYPNIEPTQYELQQVWLDSKNRKLIRN